MEGEKEKIKILFNFIKKQVLDTNKRVVKFIYEDNDNNLAERIRISTLESDLTIEIYTYNMNKIKGNGLKKFEVKISNSEGFIFVKQGKEKYSLKDEELIKAFNELINTLESSLTIPKEKYEVLKF